MGACVNPGSLTFCGFTSLPYDLISKRNLAKLVHMKTSHWKQSHVNVSGHQMFCAS